MGPAGGVSGMRAVLLGPNQQENLALQYLAAAARQAGHEARLVAFNSRTDIANATKAVIELGPDIVGIAMQFQHSIGDGLQLARTLREAGFAGHLTCGGHVATFCYAELLRDGAFDSVVRHEGERTFAELLDVLADGRSPAGLAGLVWREADGMSIGPPRPLANDLDSLPWPERQPNAYLVAGIPIAFLLTSRGCTEACSYCSISAFSRDAAGPAFRLRAPEAVAQEVEHLYQGGARAFFVQDDLFVLGNEAATLARVAALSQAFRSRGIDNAVFWVKGRPDTLTAPVVRGLAAMGAVHLFLGVESAVAERLAYLGRSHRPEDNQRAIALCHEHGIVPSFNLMLFDPDCSLEHVAQTVQFAREHVALPWNICRTEIYSGTKLYHRLNAEGRLEGDYRSYGYRMRDERAELMFRLLRVALHERAFAFDSLLNRLISLSFGRQLHEHFFPGPSTDRLSREVLDLVCTVHADTLEILDEARALAAGKMMKPEDARQWAVDMALAASRRDLPWYAQVGRLWEHLHLRGRSLLGRIGARPDGS
jgi:anaerobic magnesium-protoporphyrin IX monomethyl ester cyclase